MRLLLSYYTTQFKALRETWRLYEALKGKLMAFGTTREDDLNCGGKVLILDWERKQVERTADIPQAAGLLEFQDRLLCAAYDKILILDSNLNIAGQIDDHRFNNIHGLSLTPSGFAAASTGIDTILFLDKNLRVYDAWCALDHGFAVDQLGNRREMDLEHDHRGVIYPTLLHTTHLNSLLWVEKDKADCGQLYATFFHQGTVQRIEPRVGTETIIEGLRAPHALTRHSSGGIMVADSANNRLVIWKDNKDEAEIIEIPDCDWVQDAKEIPGNGNYIIADCNHCRILEIDGKGAPISEWNYDDDWKIQGVMVLQT